MKWCRFEINGKNNYGIINGDTVTLVEGSPFETYQITPTKHALNNVKLLIPVVPKTFYCVGINYSDHIIKSAAKFLNFPRDYRPPPLPCPDLTHFFLSWY